MEQTRKETILIRVANAPCSWGVIENVAGERQGYAWVLDEMHETGYQGTELGDWGFMPTDPDKLRQELIEFPCANQAQRFDSRRLQQSGNAL